MPSRDLLLDLSDDVFGRTSRRLEGLTDEELLWEPAPNCWSVRVRTDGTVREDWAPYVGDAEVTHSGFVGKTRTGGSAAQPPPLTNLAWRVCHLTRVYGYGHHAQVLLDKRGVDVEVTPRATSAEALADLSAAHGRWREVLAAMTDARLNDPVPGSRHRGQTRVGHVMYMIDEYTHHGAELGLLRDLFAQTRRPDPLAADPLNLADVGWAGMWHRMPTLIEGGADPEAESRGVRVLHLAAASGERDIVERLLRCGADAQAQCPLPVVWGGTPTSKWTGETPVQWAEHFGRTEVVEILRAHLEVMR